MAFATCVLSWDLSCSCLCRLTRPNHHCLPFCRTLVRCSFPEPGLDSSRFLIQILPASVVAPLYFQGKIGFGVINQSSSAFNHILSDVSLIVYQVGKLLQAACLTGASQRMLS